MMGVLSFQNASRSLFDANRFSVGDVHLQAKVKLEKLASVNLSVSKYLEAYWSEE